jgi:transcriptional regulator of heat shock response
MESMRVGNSRDWAEKQQLRIEREQGELNKKIEALNRRISELENEQEQMKASYERDKDPDLHPEFQRLVERGIMRVTNKREELKMRRAELMIKKNELESEARLVRALMEHEKYPEWVELKKRRDEAAEEVQRIEAEMKRLMDNILGEETQSKQAEH